MKQFWIFTLVGAFAMVCHGAPNDSTVPSTSESSLSELSCLEQRALEEKNKELVRAAIQEVTGDHDPEAVDKYYHKDLIQHNPWLADGSESFKKFVKEVLYKDREKETVDIRRISAEGNLVWVHFKAKNFDGTDTAFMDVVRVENGKIVEHWDVIQAIPDLSKSKNPHPLF